MQHLWHMCVTLYIAAQSFFGGQKDVFPEAMQGSFVMRLPEQLIMSTLVVWLGIVGLSKRYSENPLAATVNPEAA